MFYTIIYLEVGMIIFASCVIYSVLLIVFIDNKFKQSEKLRKGECIFA